MEGNHCAKAVARRPHEGHEPAFAEEWPGCGEDVANLCARQRKASPLAVDQIGQELTHLREEVPIELVGAKQGRLIAIQRGQGGGNQVLDRFKVLDFFLFDFLTRRACEAFDQLAHLEGLGAENDRDIQLIDSQRVCGHLGFVAGIQVINKAALEFARGVLVEFTAHDVCPHGDVGGCDVAQPPIELFMPAVDIGYVSALV